MLVTLTLAPWMFWVGGIGLVVGVVVGYCIKTWNKRGKELLLAICGISIIVLVIGTLPVSYYYTEFLYPQSIMPSEWYNAMKNHDRYNNEMIKYKEMERFIKNGPPKISRIGLDEFLSKTGLSDDIVIKQLLDFVDEH